MHAPKTRTTDIASSPEAVFAALLGTVQHGKFQLAGLNNELRMVIFTSGKTALSWGQEYVAEVHADSGQARLDVMCGGKDARPKALLDGWKNGKAADKVIAAVHEVLAGTTSAPVQPTPSFITTSDGSTRPWIGRDATG